MYAHTCFRLVVSEREREERERRGGERAVMGGGRGGGKKKHTLVLVVVVRGWGGAEGFRESLGRGSAQILWWTEARQGLWSERAAARYVR